MQKKDQLKSYWRQNLRLLLLLLFFWFILSYGTGILFKDYLDQFYLRGFPLGFWFAQQGSIISFVIIIFIYVYRMNKLDKKYGFDKD